MNAQVPTPVYRAVSKSVPETAGHQRAGEESVLSGVPCTPFNV